MMKKTLPIILIFVLCGLVFGQELGKAIKLPKPPAAWKTCKCKFGSSKDKVLVQIEIDENGNVIKAFALSGHPLFRAVSETAARFSKFTQSFLDGKPQPTYSETIYAFDIKNDKITIKKPILRFTKDIVKVKNPIKLGIINARASFLPKPIYPQEAKDFCAKGKVEVEVLLDERGNVIEAKAISGDELLRDSAVEAVKQAKFNVQGDWQPVKIRGIIVYNFDSFAEKCVSVGVVNKKALSIPEPVFPIDCHCSGDVIVQIVIDTGGKVLSARAISGHPLLRIAAEKSAIEAKFPPILTDGQGILTWATLIYNFKNAETRTK